MDRERKCKKKPLAPSTLLIMLSTTNLRRDKLIIFSFKALFNLLMRRNQDKKPIQANYFTQLGHSISNELLKILSRFKNRKKSYILQKLQQFLCMLEGQIQKDVLDLCICHVLNILQPLTAQNQQIALVGIQSINQITSIDGYAPQQFLKESASSCLGCVQYFTQNLLKNWFTQRDNLIILNSEILGNLNIFSKILGALINCNNWYALIVGEGWGKKNHKKYGINNQEYISICKKNICQTIKYYGLLPEQIQIKIAQIPIYQQTIPPNQFVIRLSLLVLHKKKVHFKVVKESSSNKNFSVQCFSLLDGQVIQLSFVQAYKAIIDRYYSKHSHYTTHQRINCAKPALKEDMTSINKENFANIKIQASLVNSTVVAIHGAKKQQTIYKMKELLGKEKIFYQIETIQKCYIEQSKFGYWIISHSCPYEPVQSILHICNKDGSLLFGLCEKKLKIVYQQFFQKNKYEKFDKMAKSENMPFKARNTNKGLVKQLNSNPIIFTFQTIKDSMMAWCWMIAEDIRRVQFIK